MALASLLEPRYYYSSLLLNYNILFTVLFVGHYYLLIILQVTIADFYVYAILDEIIATTKNSIISFPSSSLFHSSISSCPSIATYITSPSRYPPILAGYLN